MILLYFILSFMFWSVVVFFASLVAAVEGNASNGDSTRVAKKSEFIVIIIPFVLITIYKIFSVYTNQLPILSSFFSFLFITVLPFTVSYLILRGPVWMVKSEADMMTGTKPSTEENKK